MKHRNGRVEAEQLRVEIRPGLSVTAGVLSRDLDSRLAGRVPSLQLAVYLFGIVVGRLTSENGGQGLLRLGGTTAMSAGTQ